MGDVTDLEFGGSEGVLRYIQEKSDDIEAVVIPQFHVGHIPATGNSPGVDIEDVGLVLHMVNGNQQLVQKQDAEVVLNDGILNRMRIKIYLWSAKDGTSFEIPK